MGCRHCNCRECVELREDSSNWRDWRDAAPLQGEEEAKVRAAMDTVFSQFPRTRINLPAMIALIMTEIKVTLKDYHRLSLQTQRFLLEGAERGDQTYTLKRGAHGGIMRTNQAAPIPYKEPVKAASSIDYTCKGCNVVLRDLSQAEKSCYRCGEPIVT